MSNMAPRQHPETTASDSSLRGPHLNQTRMLRESLTDPDDLCARVLAVLKCMDDNGLNLALFLWAISWNSKPLVQNGTARFARTALMVSDELPEILKNWHQPPRQHNTGIRTKAAQQAMADWALDTICETLDRESAALADLMSLPQDELSEEALLSIRWKKMISDVKGLAPTMWKLFRHTAYTPQQDARNTHKNPDSVVLAMVAMSSYSRSHHRCKIAKLLTVYFKSCGLATKAFDTLNALGISMSQKRAYDAIDELSTRVQQQMRDDIASYP